MYNPYTDHQASYQNTESGPSYSGGAPTFSLPAFSGIGRPFFGHGPKDSVGSSEPLLWGISGSDSPPEPATPAVPPRNPLRLLSGTGDRRGTNDGHGDGGISNDENIVYDPYEESRKPSLKVRNNPD